MKTLLIFLVSFLIGISSAWAQWVSQAVPANIKSVRKVSVVDPNVIWAQGLSFATTNGPDHILRTLNGGQTWSNVPVALPGVTHTIDIFSLEAVDANIAYITVFVNSPGPGPHTRVYKTDDAGLTWSQIPNMYTTQFSFVNLVEFFDASNGLIVGDNLEFYTTNDGGTTWVRVPATNLPPANSAADFSFDHRVVIGNTIWIPAGNMRVYKSTDKGLTWTVSATNIPNLPGQSLAGIAFQDAMNGLISKGSALSRTTDGGQTWTTVNYTGTFFEQGLAHITGTPDSYVSFSGTNANPGLSVSHDGGLSWTQLDSSAHHSATFMNNRLGWSGGNGVIYKLDGIALSTSNAVAAASSFTISPNPSTGVFIISGTTLQKYTIEVYNLTGLKVYQKQSRAFMPTIIDLTNQPRGIYLVRLVAKGQILTKKILLN